MTEDIAYEIRKIDKYTKRLDSANNNIITKSIMIGCFSLSTIISFKIGKYYFSQDDDMFGKFFTLFSGFPLTIVIIELISLTKTLSEKTGIKADIKDLKNKLLEKFRIDYDAMTDEEKGKNR